MEKKYGVTAALICADQLLTDDYQIWGSWWGVPYYPSRYNVLLPAQTEKNKLDLVIFQWAARDPVNGYGGGGFESSFSVQVNDYMAHGLDVSYFEQLVEVYTGKNNNHFGQLTVGLENDYNWRKYEQGYKEQIGMISKRDLSVLTMKDFAAWYRLRFPGLSLDHKIEALDPLETDKKAIWLMSTNGRVGLLKEEGGTVIRDWRLYHERWAEPYLEVANKNHQLKLSLPAKIDGVRFPDQRKELSQDPSKLIEKRLSLPFATPRLIFILMVLIFVSFLIWAVYLDKWLWLLMIVGMATQIMTMVKSGLLYPFGMGFWGPNGHDGIWHLALIQELTRHFPPQSPVFAGQPLFNYHYLFDLIVALIHKLTRLPVINLYFQIFPIILSGFLGILTYLLVKRLTKNRLALFLAVFFVYFGGSFGWLVTLFRGQGIGGESMFWASQAVSFLINPPFASSIILILFGLIIFIDYLKKATMRKLIIAGLVLGSLMGVKSYGGVVVLAGLLVAALWQVFREKKTLILKLFLVSLTVGLLIFLPSVHKAGTLFVFVPFWFSRTMLLFSDRLGWVRLEQARHAYLASGNWRRWFLAEGLALVIFFIGNLGTRILALGKIFAWLKNLRRIKPLQVFILSCLLTSAVIPLFFIQKGNPWNSIQFFYYFLFFTAILTAWWFGEFLAKRKTWMKAILVIGLILLTIPTTLGMMKHYLPYRAPARISFDELEALWFLKNQPEGIILTYPHDYWLRESFEAPKPVYVYETTAYVSAFANKRTFLEDEMNLEIMQADWQPRREELERFFATTDPTWAREFLEANNIRYIYLIDDQSFFPNPVQLELEKIFENGLVRIYQARGIIDREQ